MDKIRQHIIFFFFICASYAVSAQTEPLIRLDNAEKKLQNAIFSKNETQISHVLVENMLLYAQFELNEKVLQTFRQLNERYETKGICPDNMPLAFECLSKFYEEQREFFIAISYLERASKLAEKKNQTRLQIQFGQKLCALLLHQKNNENSKKVASIITKSDSLLLFFPNDTLFSLVQLRKSHFLCLEEKYTQSVALAEKILPFFEKNRNFDALILLYQLMAKGAECQNEPDRAVFFLKKYDTIRDSFFENSKNKKKDIASFWESIQKDKALINNTLLLEKQNKKITYLKYGILVLLSSLFGFLSFFVYFRRKVKQKIAFQQTEIKLYTEELKSFNYSVSHDLKAPLVEMQNQLAQINTSTKDIFSPETKQNLIHISDMLTTTRKMIDEMLAYSITENQYFEPRKFDSSELIEDVLYQFEHTIRDKNITIKVAPNCPQVYGDVAMLRQVFQNLISNAIKFSQHNPKPIILIDYQKDAKNITFLVSDNGIGFDEQYKERLFQLFKRLPTQQKYEGTGAGLAVVKRIVTRHSGSVWAEGYPNDGAIFYFSLPKLS